MPELSTLLQQHVAQLSQQPAGGFSAVRAKARRRTQQRVVGLAAAAAAIALVAAMAGNGAFRRTHPQPGHPTPGVTSTSAPSPTPVTTAKAATLVQTHWRMTSITAFGTTTPVDDEQVYLYVHVPTLGGWLMRVHCGNIAGGVTLGQSDRFVTTVKAPGSCAAKPLTKAVARVLRSPVNDKVVGQQLTLVGATGAMTFVAEPETVSPLPLTSRVWQLTSMKTAGSMTDLFSNEGASPDALWLVFGRGSFTGGVACGMVQGTALPTGHYLDLAGLSEVNTDGCTPSSVHAEVKAAYQQLVQDGRVQWSITGTRLELRGTSTVLTFADHGPAGALEGSAAPSS